MSKCIFNLQSEDSFNLYFGVKIGSQYFTGLCDNPSPARVDYFCLNHLLCCRRAALPSRASDANLCCWSAADELHSSPQSWRPVSGAGPAVDVTLSYPVSDANLCYWCAVNCSARPALSSPLSKASLCCWLYDACCR